MIRSAQMTLEVGPGRFDEALASLVQLAGEEGGYVSATSAGAGGGDRIRSGVVTFMVPVPRFQDTLDRLRKMGTVQGLQVSSRDVSQEYVDVQARLRNSEAQRDALLALLRKATSITDILQVQAQVGQVTAQIEQLKGQIDYLDHATAYSPVSVTLREAGAGEPKPADEWGLETAFWQSLHYFVASVDALVLALGTAGPYLLLGALALGIWLRRRRPARNTV